MLLVASSASARSRSQLIMAESSERNEEVHIWGHVTCYGFIVLQQVHHNNDVGYLNLDRQHGNKTSTLTIIDQMYIHVDALLGMRSHRS